MSDIPVWFKESMAEWQTRLGLLHWRVEYEMSPHPNGDGEGRTQAVTYLYPDIRTAKMEFGIGLAEIEEADQYWKECLIHELLHVLMADLTEFVNFVVLPQLGTAQRDMLMTVFSNEVEPVIEQLARTLYAAGDRSISPPTGLKTSE